MSRSNADRDGVPDLLAVLADRTVRRKPPRTRHVENRHARPPVDVAVGGGDRVLTGDVGLEVSEEEEVVAFDERVDERAEERRVAPREHAGRDLVDGLSQLRVPVVVRPRRVAARA